MAKCRNCGTEVPDGSEYCAECVSKLNTAKDSESYLDSLLNAVMTEEPKQREIVFPKKEASSLVSMPTDRKTEEPVVSEELPQEFINVPEEDASSIEAFDTFFEGEEELPDLKNYSIFGDVDEGTVDRMLAEDLGETGLWGQEDVQELQEENLFEEESEEEHEDSDFNDLSAFYLEEEPESEEQEEVPLSEVSDIEDLFGMLEDERGADAPPEIEMAIPEVISTAELDAAADTFSGIVEAQEEEAEEEVLTEFGDFADLFGSTQEDTGAGEPEPVSQPADDFADLFAGLGDEDGMFEFGAQPIELEDSTEDEDLLASVAAAVSVAETSQTEADAVPAEKKEKTQGPFSRLYHKLFDNVKVDPSKIKQPPTKEELEAKKREKEEAKTREKEEKEALLAEKKEQEKQVKLEKQRAKKEAKAEKKAKKMEEAKLLLEEMEKTRINRAGASIVFIFFAMIAVVIIVGTSIFSYSLSIKNAEHEFNRDEYTAAYNEIYGLEIKDEDIMLYDRIMTVMYVQKQLNSYDNYYRMNDKPKALDSLLKGLQRYEKYIELAVELDVDTDLDSVRNKILENISSSFMLTEQEAMEIIQSDNQAEYSKKVYDAVERLEE
ncbi:MAG: hypothetical protein IKT67_06475 [Lachnospiraceae bacterium]|nr:hypothetical protein [Lachnospiraceae bacterium]